MLFRRLSYDQSSSPERGPRPVAAVALAGVGLRWGAAAATVIALAAGLRVATLTSKSLWFDETYSVLVASLPVGRLLAVTAANDAHPPLYYLMLHAWLGLFGDGEGAVRSLSVVISAPIVLLTWLFGRRLVGSAPALVAAAFVAVAPSQVAAGQEARMYGLLSLAALASWWTLWTAVAEGKQKAWWGYTLVTATLLFAHYYGFFVIASQGVYLLWRRTRAHLWWRWLTAGLGVVILLLPWIPALLQQIASGRAWPTYRPPISVPLLFDTFASLTVGRPVFEVAGDGSLPRWLVWGLAAIVCAAAAAGYRSLRRERDAAALLVCAGLVPVILSFAVSYGIHVFAPRYTLFVVPPLALLVSAGLAANGPFRRWIWPAAVIGLIVMVVMNTFALARFYRQPRLDVFDWRRVSRALAASAQPDDAIVFLPGFARVPVNYYFRGPQLRLALTPDGTDVVGPDAIRMSGVVNVLARHRRVWIVTVPPIPPSVDGLVTAMRQLSYGVKSAQAINMARLLLLEDTGPP